MNPGWSRPAVPDRWSAFLGAPNPDVPAAIVGDGWFTVPSDTVLSHGSSAVGHSVLPQQLVEFAPSLIVTDVDSTLINEEVIDQLAQLAGVGPAVAQITELAMAGDLDFSASLRERVKLLRGLPEQALAEVASSITLTPGAAQFVSWAHSVGAQFGVVSGGFTRVIEPLTSSLGITHVLANSLEVRDGCLTGRTEGPVVTATSKAQALTKWSAGDLGRTVAVGDGANDIPMLRAAAAGFAFCAKPAVKAATRNHLDIRRLDAVAGLLGWDPEV